MTLRARCRPLLALMLAVSMPAWASEPTERAAVDWVKHHATPLATGGRPDLAALRPIVRDARFVGFGEAIHRGHEFFTLRNEIFRYLVEELGFTAIASESGYAASIKVDDYVLGRGPLTDDVIAAVFSFTAPTAYEENRSLIEWMRSYNARPGVKRKVRFYGLESMGKAGDGQPYMREGIDLALDYLSAIDAEQGASFARRLTPSIDKTVRDGYESLSATERDAYTLGLADLVGVFERNHVQWVARTSPLDYQRAYRNALNARALDADFRNFGWWISRHGDRNQRDASAAQMAEWLLSREGPEGRIFLYAHNLHLRKGPVVSPRHKFTSMGQHLAETQGSQFVVIASAYESMHGAFEKPRGSAEETATDAQPAGSVSAVLSAAAMPRFVLDLRAGAAADPGGRWWEGTKVFHGAGTDTVTLNPRECFDALIFSRDATPARERERR